MRQIYLVLMMISLLTLGLTGATSNASGIAPGQIGRSMLFAPREIPMGPDLFTITLVALGLGLLALVLSYRKRATVKA